MLEGEISTRELEHIYIPFPRSYFRKNAFPSFLARTYACRLLCPFVQGEQPVLVLANT
jgi:hypothetical protein